MARIGYGRVSTRDQNPDSQHDALTAAGCEKIFIDKASGKLARRPEWDECLLRGPSDHARLHTVGQSLVAFVAGG
jgi:hypothetical protein